MNFEPQKFFIGLIDFFTIILPGALLSWFVGGELAKTLLEPEAYCRLIADYALPAFLFSSYLLGHFIFLIGAPIDLIYDRIRDASPQRQASRQACDGSHPWPLTRFLAWWWLKKDSERAVRLAEAIRDRQLRPFGDPRAINTFQWSKASLALDSPELLADVHRFEADSKFFRSLVVVILLLLIWSAIAGSRSIHFAAIGLPFLLLAFWRYFERRVKATELSYCYLITRQALSHQSTQQEANGSTTSK